MSEQKKPKKSKEDVIHALTKATISKIPIAGAHAAEIFALVVTPPYERRRDEWIESIGNGLKELAEKVKGFKIEDLSNNETFITTITHASQAAIRNHQKEKLEALRNAVLNAALPNAPEEDLELMFLNFVDNLTVWQLAILKCLDNPSNWVQKIGVKPPASNQIAFMYKFLEQIFPELEGRGSLYSLWMEDLYSRGLIKKINLYDGISSNNLLTPRTTGLGRLFIEFITNPINQKEQ